jgi:hypothetical protein
MPLWLEDATFHFANALRGVGVALAAVLWASMLSLHLQWPAANQRVYLLLGSLVLGALVTHFFGGLPPSATVVDLLQPHERDMLAAARERAGGDPERMYFLAGRLAVHAAVSVAHGASVPKDRRAWFRALAQRISGREAELDSRQDGLAPD